MVRIGQNRLLLWSIVALIGYWGSAFVLPGQIMASATSLFLLIAGTVTFFRYAPDAWAVVVRRKRNVYANEGGGSHLAAYGVTLLAAGSCYVGSTVCSGPYIGQPGTWLGTAYSGFGGAVICAGFLLLFLSGRELPRHRPAAQALADLPDCGGTLRGLSCLACTWTASSRAELSAQHEIISLGELHRRRSQL